MVRTSKSFLKLYMNALCLRWCGFGEKVRSVLASFYNITILFNLILINTEPVKWYRNYIVLPIIESHDWYKVVQQGELYTYQGEIDFHSGMNFALPGSVPCEESEGAAKLVIGAITSSVGSCLRDLISPNKESAGSFLVDAEPWAWTVGTWVAAESCASWLCRELLSGTSPLIGVESGPAFAVCTCLDGSVVFASTTGLRTWGVVPSCDSGARAAWEVSLLASAEKGGSEAWADTWPEMKETTSDVAETFLLS